jgi:S1-C subfamily serine protease
VAGLLAACVLTLSAPAGAPVSSEVDIRHDATVDAVKRVLPCVVNIGTETVVEVNDPFEELFRQFYGPRYQIAPSLGSGMIIDEDGYILTNLHVVRRARRIQVKLSEEAGGQEYEAELISAFITTDVALLKIVQNPKEKPRKFKAIKLAKDDDLMLGETVLALGNPFGLGGSVCRGILSSKQRATPKENEELGVENWLQTDASINPGNSGGPIINLKGEMIGMSEAILRGAQGIGFAIPIKEVRLAVAHIFTPESKERWFGATVKPTEAPLVIESVENNSPAAKAGLRAGDQILEVNGRMPSGFEFHRWMREETNSIFKLTIQREGQKKDISVRLLGFSELLRQRMGVDAQDLQGALARQFGLREYAGLLIAGVEKNGPAFSADLRRNYLITGIDEARVRSLSDLVAIIYDKPKGEVVSVSLLVPQTRGDEILGYAQGVVRLKLR